MKAIGIIAVIILLSFGFSKNVTKVKITNKSEVTIKGKSNVNSFECKYNSDFIEDEIHVSVTKSNSKILLDGAKIAIKSNGFDCAHKMITRDFKSILKADENPHIVINVKEINNTKENITAKLNVKIAESDIVTAKLRPNPSLNNQTLQLMQSTGFHENTQENLGHLYLKQKALPTILAGLFALIIRLEPSQLHVQLAPSLFA